MKEWERRNAEEMVEGFVGMDLAGIERTMAELSVSSLERLGDYLASRYSPNEKSFAGILQGLLVIELAGRHGKGGGGE